MTDEEQLVLNFLKATPEAYYTRREIARRAVKRRVYDDNPHWPDAALSSLLARHIIEQNENDLYRMKQVEEDEKPSPTARPPSSTGPSPFQL